MIKDILLKLPLDPSRDASSTYAMALAGAFGAHLTAIALSYEPEMLADPSGPGAARFMRLREDGEKAAHAAIAHFEKNAGGTGLRPTTRVIATTVADAYRLFGRLGRRFDLTVIRQAEADMSPADAVVAEGALFESGRPVIVVPYAYDASFALDRLMVCWDGSRPAARALADAMPLLARANIVHVVIVETERAKSDEMPGADVAEHLARHGLPVSVSRIPRANIDIKDALLNYAADKAIDLIVMGGYGHSRTREFILGGVTRGMLETMTVPTLFSH